MKVNLMNATTANDFLAIRDKIMDGEFVSVSEKNDTFNLYCLLLGSRCDCHCYVFNGIAVFGKLTTDEFYKFVLEIEHLKKSKLANMPVDKVERFVQYAAAFGYNVMGGAISDDCKSQYLYID